MVIDPPDGRVPVMKWAEDKRDYDIAHIPDAPEHETPWVRCITRGYPAAFFPAGYNNAYEIIQTPGYVVIVFEMIHETRIIPIDGRPKLGANISSGTASRAADGRATRSSSSPRTTTTRAPLRPAQPPAAFAAFRRARR